jgi:hypothetical protein
MKEELVSQSEATMKAEATVKKDCVSQSETNGDNVSQTKTHANDAKTESTKKPPAPKTIFDVLVVTVVFRLMLPDLPLDAILCLAATSRDIRKTIFNSPDVFMFLDLSKAPFKYLQAHDGTNSTHDSSVVLKDLINRAENNAFITEEE